MAMTLAGRVEWPFAEALRASGKQRHQTPSARLCETAWSSPTLLPAPQVLVVLHHELGLVSLVYREGVTTVWTDGSGRHSSHPQHRRCGMGYYTDTNSVYRAEFLVVARVLEECHEIVSDCKGVVKAVQALQTGKRHPKGRDRSRKESPSCPASWRGSGLPPRIFMAMVKLMCLLTKALLNMALWRQMLLGPDGLTLQTTFSSYGDWWARNFWSDPKLSLVSGCWLRLLRTTRLILA
eukprot:6461173-Amphidinium_carterae.3